MPIVFDFADLLKAQTAPHKTDLTIDLSKIGEKSINFEALLDDIHPNLTIPATDPQSVPTANKTQDAIEVLDWNADGAVEDIPAETLASILNIPIEELKSAIAKVANHAPQQAWAENPKPQDAVNAKTQDIQKPTEVNVIPVKNTEQTNTIGAAQTPIKIIPTGSQETADLTRLDTKQEALKSHLDVRVTAIRPMDVSVPQRSNSIQPVIPPTAITPDPQTDISENTQIELDEPDKKIGQRVEWMPARKIIPPTVRQENIQIPGQTLRVDISSSEFDSASEANQTDNKETFTPVSTSSTTTAHPMQRSVNAPIVQQILRHLPTTEIAKQQQYEIELSPRELGHVKITMVPTEANMNILISCERDETSNLLRRNLNELTQDMHEIGYANVDIEFGQGSEDTSKGQQFSTSQQRDTQDQPTTTPASIHITLGGGVDLKI